MVELKLSRQLLKVIYLQKIRIESETNDRISMSEFIEECLMEYLNINIVDINSEKVPVKLDMYYGKNIYTDYDNISNVSKSDNEPDNEDISFSNYVYVYMNPLKKLEQDIVLNISGEEFIFDYEPFYIGKGRGSRMFEHLRLHKTDININKKNLISEIIENGKEPVIRIIKNELTTSEAFTLENIIITKLENLTNISGGKSNRAEYININKVSSIEYSRNKYIMKLIDQGKKNREISELLGISERTLYRIKNQLKI